MKKRQNNAETLPSTTEEFVTWLVSGILAGKFGDDPIWRLSVIVEKIVQTPEFGNFASSRQQEIASKSTNEGIGYWSRIEECYEELRFWMWVRLICADEGFPAKHIRFQPGDRSIDVYYKKPSNCFLRYLKGYKNIVSQLSVEQAKEYAEGYEVFGPTCHGNAVIGTTSAEEVIDLKGLVIRSLEHVLSR